MEIKQETLNNGTIIKYKIVNGTAYHINTPDTIINIMEKARENRTRLRFHWGNVETGEDWGDIYDVTGYIGRSTGSIKIPLLVHNSRSMGGGAILDHCIVKITTSKGKQTLYKHPNYFIKEIN